MTGRPLRSLLSLAVRLNGIELGRVVDALVDVDSRRVVGLEVACGDNGLRFVPLGAARVRDDEIDVGSPLILLEENDQGFYRKRGRTFSRLVGTPVARGEATLGKLVDLVLDDEGAIVAVRAAANGTTRDLPVADVATLGGSARETAA